MLKKRKSFTLIELLVVIAIISMLAAILLPSLRNARDMAKRIACIQNMKQIGLGLMLYVNDNRGWLPQIDAIDTNQHWYWFQALSTYVSNDDKLYGGGPEANNNISGNSTGWIIGQNLTWVCPKTLWYDAPTFDYPRVVCSYGTTTGGYDEGGAYLYGFAGTNVNTYDRKIPGQYFIKDPNTIFIVCASIRSYGRPSVWLSADLWNNPSAQQQIGFYHEDGTNCLFADIHVEWIKKSVTMGTRVGGSGTGLPTNYWIPQR